MRVHIEETELFQFAELSDEAKEKAIENNREWNIHDDWFDCVYETYSTFLAMIGADCELTPGKTIAGRTTWKPSICFSGFGSQGDGASFDCNYSYKSGAVKAIASEFGGEDGEKFKAYAKRLIAAQKRVFYSAEIGIRRQGRYYHSNTMYSSEFNLLDSYSQETYSRTESDILEIFRDIADSLYRDLEKEYEYLTSNESVQTSLELNEIEFNENGGME